MVALLLALADSGIPVQTDAVPEPLLKKLQPGKISGFLCLGNVGSAVVRSLKRIATDMRFVAGDTEEESHLPLAQVCLCSFALFSGTAPREFQSRSLHTGCSFYILLHVSDRPHPYV